jgi:ornithine cyclodeaminase
VVEYTEQSLVEGEIQNCGSDSVYAELWEIVSGAKAGRESADEITFFDSVGFAAEDLSILKLVYRLTNQYEIGDDAYMIPELSNPKDLYGLLFSP